MHGMATQSEMVFNNEKWTKIESYSEERFLDNSTSWPFQGEETMSEAFLTLLKTLPPEIVSSKDVSELEILTLAMDYIKRLENVLDKDLPKTPDVKG